MGRIGSRRQWQRWRGRQFSAGALALLLSFAPDGADARPLGLARLRVPIRKDKVAVELAVQDPGGTKVRVITREPGAPDVVQKEVSVGPGSALKTEIPANGSAVLKFASPTPAAPSELPSSPKEMSGLLVESRTDPDNAALRQLSVFSPVLYAREVPLRWQQEHHQYETELAVGLMSSGDEPATPRPLGSPVFIQLFGEGVEVSPGVLEIAQPGTAGFQSALIALSRHEDRGKVTAVSDFGEQSYTVTASAQFSALSLNLDLNPIPGFGIGTARVSAVRSAEDGRELLEARPLPVSFTSTGGRLTQATLAIPTNQSRTDSIELRSSWFGTYELRASADGVMAPPVQIMFSIPWSILLSILFGAAAGTAARTIWNRRRSQRETLGGFLVGVLVALGAFVGIGYTGLIPATALFSEIGCFMLATIAGYTGRPALDWIAGLRGKPGATG